MLCMSGPARAESGQPFGRAASEKMEPKTAQMSPKWAMAEKSEKKFASDDPFRAKMSLIQIEALIRRFWVTSLGTYLMVGKAAWPMVGAPGCFFYVNFFRGWSYGSLQERKDVATAGLPRDPSPPLRDLNDTGSA